MSSSSTDPASPRPLLEVGRIEKPHGVRGEVIVRLTTNRAERLAPGSVLTTSTGPLEVVSSRPHQDRWCVAFAGLRDREGAEARRGTVLLAEAIDDPDELWVHELVGARLVDQHGTDHGRVVDVLANPASDLLELDGGALVPVRFVVGVTPRERVDVDVPDGLFDLG
jgi:16S rRNA processing protein RimM